MATFLLTWVPKRYPLTKLREIEIAKTQRGEPVQWGTGVSEKLHPGDRVYAQKQGSENPGIFGVGTITSEVYEAKLGHDRQGATADSTTPTVDVIFDTLLDPELDELLPTSLLKKRVPGVYWHSRMSGVQVPNLSAKQIGLLWDDHRRQLDVIDLEAMPSESDVRQSTTEGLRRLVKHLRIERRPGIVSVAKKKWYRENPFLPCSCCGDSFRALYGERGNNFIEAHHTKPLGNLKKGEEVATMIDDLAPVCGNCHRMLHRKPFLAIPELAAVLASTRKASAGVNSGR